MIQLYLKPSRMAMLPGDLPIEIFSGLEDPCGGFGAHARELHQKMTQAGKSAGLTLYPGCRHDILHDEEGDDMTQMIAQCMDEWLGQDE